MDRENRGDGFQAIGDMYKGYTVYDMHYEKIGKVDDIFVDENDQPEYIGVKMGFLGLRSTLIPIDVVRVNEQRQLMEVSESKERVKEAPTFDDDEDITPDLEQRVRGHFGLAESGGERGGYDAYYDRDDRDDREQSVGAAGSGMGDREDEFREPARGEERVSGRGGDVEDDDELRIQRSEEELRAGTREREAGKVNVRKRVRTERKRISVPRMREQVSVERVPVGDREASESEIGEDEVVIPVVEEEIVVQKRAVVKEEIRVRKDVVQEEEIVEADLRKEEVDIEDTTGRSDR